MSGPILPPIPMLTGSGNGQALMVIGILVALVLVAKANADKAAKTAS